MNESENLVPKRRFKEFTNTGTWEQRKLIDVAEMFDNLRIPVTASDRVEGNTAYYGANGIQDYVDGFTHDGEFVLIAEDGANDLINYPVNYVKGKIWVNNHAHVVSGKKSELDNLFLTARIKSMNISHWLVGGGRAKLNGDVLKKIPLTLPIYEEQKKIGAFFKQLDDAIALHQRKLEKSKALKSAYLSEMFPAEGERKPKRRFAGFTDDWEQRKLEELAESFNYGLNASAMEFDGENKYIRITDIDEQSHKFIQSGLTSPNIDLLNADDYLLKEGDILFARTGASVGKSYQYEPLDGKVYFAGFLIRARIKPEFDPSFIFQNTLTEKYNNFIKVTSQRSGQPGVNAQEYANFSILIPSRGEQVKLGNFFKQLDDTIALHQHKLEKLQNIKQAYLNELFV